MVNLLQTLHDELIKKLVAFLQRNIFQSIGTTVAFTVLIMLALLNPWFGSSSAKTMLIDFMINDHKDLVPIVEDLRDDKEFRTIFDSSLRHADYFEAGNRAIIDEWQERWAAGRMDESKAAQEQDMAAILDARSRARKWAPPFDPGGVPMSVGRPACADEQPQGANIIVSKNSNILESTSFKVGDRVRIQRVDRRGGYVVALVQRGNIDGADAWLNSSQFDDTLEAPGPTAMVFIVKTNEELTPVGEDGRVNYPDCRRGNAEMAGRRPRAPVRP